eukprot:Skav234547  [mRNA]  locus=scaffold2556:285047:286573:- [translate_table: standard]
MSHPGDHPQSQLPAVDLTSPVDDGIEDITPPIHSREAASFPPTSPLQSTRPAPTTPPHLRHASNQQPPAHAEDEACPICLMAIHPANTGPTSCLHWPHCGHAIHTGCAAHLVVEQPRPPCPTCRQPWVDTSEAIFEAQCRAEGVTLPEPLPFVDTRGSSPTPPAAPQDVLPLCCHRLFLRDPEHPETNDAWQELPDRHMEWAPSHQPHNNTWLPEWICLRCNASFSLAHPLRQELPERPRCAQHGLRTLAVDVPRYERGWICCRVPSLIHPCPAEQVPNPTSTDVATDATRAMPRHAPHHLPPDHQPGPTNSWLFVPLLLAATRQLDTTVLQRWNAQPLGLTHWQPLVQQLQRAPAVHWQHLHGILAALQGMSHQLPLSERRVLQQLYDAGSRQPTGTQVHLGWAVEQVMLPNGYIPATAQEALLQAYLGDHGASMAATLADRWRHNLANPSPTSRPHDAAPPAVPSPAIPPPTANGPLPLTRENPSNDNSSPSSTADRHSSPLRLGS